MPENDDERAARFAKEYGPDYAMTYDGVEGREHLPYITTFTCETLNIGMSGWVKALDDHLVIKHRHVSWDWRDSVRDLAQERLIYERLGDHPLVTKYLGPLQNGLLFERLKTSIKIHLHYMKEEGKRPTQEQCIRWSIQAAEALAYVHSHGVRQSDISCNNFLLDYEDNVKICDFAGSQIDGGEFFGCSNPSADGPDPRWNWKPGDGPIPIANELFALGSVIYEIWTMHTPYEELDTGPRMHELEELYIAQKFPEDTAALLPGNILLDCWYGRFGSAMDVAKALKELVLEITSEAKRTQPSPTHTTSQGPGSTPITAPEWLISSAISPVFVAAFALAAIFVARRAIAPVA